jgi:hypothetical protein
VANPYTATYLLNSARRRGQIPQSVGSLDTTDLLALMTDELQTYVMVALLSVRGQYGLVSKDTTIVAGTLAYDLPERAIGARLEQVQLSADGGASLR